MRILSMGSIGKIECRLREAFADEIGHRMMRSNLRLSI